MQPISHFFEHKVPDIPRVRCLTSEYARQIAECINAGHPMSHIDRYLKRPQGTIGRWRSKGKFDDYMVLTQKDVYNRLVNNHPVKRYLDLYDDVNWAPFMRAPLIFSRNLELVRALIDRKADINVNFRGTPIKFAIYIGDPAIISTLVKAGAEPMIEEYVRSTNNISTDCLITMIEAGGDITPLYYQIYNITIYRKALDLVTCLMKTGHNIVLEQTAVYKIWHNLITDEELQLVIRSIQYYVRDYNTKTEEEKYAARQEEIRPSLDCIQEVIATQKSYAASVRDTIQNITGLSYDVSYLTSKMLYEYTPY